MKIKSDQDLIKKGFKGKLALTEVSLYLEDKYGKDPGSLEFLKAELLRFKMEKAVKKVDDLSQDPKFITMRLNWEKYGKKMPFVSYMLEPKDESLSEIEHYELMQEELERFINEFLPTYFIGLTSIEVIIESMLKRDDELPQKATQNIENIPTIKWNGNQVNFYEIFKGLIETGLITLKGNEEETFEYFQKAFGLESFNLRGARQSSKKRLDDKNIYDSISYQLENWRKS